MRAEQLLLVARMVRDELTKREPITALKALVDALEAQAANPTAETQNQTAAARDSLYVSTKDSMLDQLAPIDAEILDSMKLPASFGAALARKVRSSLSGNQVTPQTALKQLKSVLSQAVTAKESIEGALENMEYLEVLPDDLKSDQFEVMIAIPGHSINNELESFGKETLQLNRIFLVFEEIVTGARTPFKLRAIASTDPTIYIYAAAGVASVVITTLEKITALYEKILGIVKLQRELTNKVPPATLDPIKEFIASEITEGLRQVKDSVLLEHAHNLSEHRHHEIDVELSFALKAIARRLDEGYLFDVRAGEGAAAPEGQETTEPTALEQQHQAAREVIAERRPALRQFQAADEPILCLTAPEDSDVV